MQDLANQAATLADTLHAFATALSASHTGVVPAIRQAIQGHTDPGQTGQALRDLVASFRKHLEWLRNVGVEPRPVTGLTIEARSRRRLNEHPLPQGSNVTNVPPAQRAAFALFHWVADWIRDCRETSPDGFVNARGEVDGGYWPPLRGGDGISAGLARAGELTKLPDQNIDVTLDAFVDTKQVIENGWPHPIAIADHFRYAIQREDRTATRQLQMLLVGLVAGELKSRKTSEVVESPESISLDALVGAFRKSDFPELARYAIVWPAKDNEVIGFNAPHTLLCAKPPADPDAVRIWASLWTRLTGSKQPENWTTEVWRHADRAIRQIQYWLLQFKKKKPGTPPAWTRIFAHQSESAPIEYGEEEQSFPIYWSPDQLVEINLPTSESGGYRPGPDTPRVSEDALLDEIPELATLRDESGNAVFEMAEFEMPDREHPFRGIWKEHLDHLQQDGRIAAFGRGEDTVFIRMPDRDRAAELQRTRILDRDDMMVHRCSPMHQNRVLRHDPVPGSPASPAATRYPDLPLRSEYIGLVQTGDERTVLDLLKEGGTSFAGQFEPVFDYSHGGRTAIWTLRLKGRRDPLTITLPVAPDGDHHRAHWMVWPRFRSTRAPFWRAYYIYEHCTDTRLRLETLWLDPESNRIRRCPAAERWGSHPIRFDAGASRAHTGGPPLAFSVRDTVSEEEIGLHLIPLTPLFPNDQDVKVGIDFGTSHTVASILTGNERQPVELRPELDPANADAVLTLHVSENRSHVEASFAEGGLSARGGWLPNYTKSVASDARGSFPSELLTTLPLERLKPEDVRVWEPGRDCVIPFMDMQRPDLADHILRDFKWDDPDDKNDDDPAEAFRGSDLRDVYLGMTVELVMADVVWRRRALPGRAVDFTFTYPLRTRPSELDDFQATLRRVMDSGSRSLGCSLTLCEGAGIYNESRAAKGGTGNFGEVSLVGDLGGGTLDLFISASTLPDVEFEEVADSARLGGNVLLKALAKPENRFLPANAGWAKDLISRETQLRAWMRSKRSPQLFGADADGRLVHKGLDIGGFDNPGQADAARRLIDRYFRLIAEYMARSLVAFLARHWYEKAPAPHHDKLRVLVQLRGNGWRLWHDSGAYKKIEKEIGRWIEERARSLWNDSNLWTNPSVPGAPILSTSDTGEANPKTAPILAAVGKAESHEDAEASCYSHTLVELDLLNAKSSLDPVPWFSRSRFETGGKATQVELNAIKPPLLLGHPKVAKSLDDFDEDLKAEVNNKLRNGVFTNDVDYRAPVAPIVWEAAFKSRRFREDD